MELIEPGDPRYDEVRGGWNGRFESRPSLIAKTASAAEVVGALALARERGLAVTVRGGGHDYAGKSSCQGGLLIDLGPMDSISVDPEARRVVVGAGCRWADVDAATQGHGLVTPGGTVSCVGVSGFTLGGGAGWLLRKHGLGCDNLLAAEVVTTAGDVLRVSEMDHPDLMWGLRGGGANLGIVTSLELALHPLDHEVLAGQVVYPFDRAGELLRFYRDHFADAPDEVMCYPFFYRVPPIDVFPIETHGEVVLSFVVACFAPVADGEAMLAPFRSLGAPILDGVFPQSYVTLQTAFDEGMSEAGNRWYSRAYAFEQLSDDCIDVVVRGAGDLTGDFTVLYLSPGGGAVGRVPADATAYPHRSSGHDLHVFAGWVDSGLDDSVMAWTREVADSIAPFANPGVYVNMLSEDESGRIPASYAGNYERMVELKTKWDPENVLSSNHNVAPRHGEPAP